MQFNKLFLFFLICFLTPSFCLSSAPQTPEPEGFSTSQQSNSFHCTYDPEGYTIACIFDSASYSFILSPDFTSLTFRSFISQSIPPSVLDLELQFVNSCSELPNWEGDYSCPLADFNLPDGSYYFVGFFADAPPPSYIYFIVKDKKFYLDPIVLAQEDRFSQYTNATSGSSFYVAKSLSYGDILILIFMILIFSWGVFRFCWNFVFKDYPSKI